MAGRDMTASPSQLVARTISRDTEEGFKATILQDSSGFLAQKSKPMTESIWDVFLRRDHRSDALAEAMAGRRRGRLRPGGGFGLQAPPGDRIEPGVARPSQHQSGRAGQ